MKKKSTFDTEVWSRTWLITSLAGVLATRWGIGLTETEAGLVGAIIGLAYDLAAYYIKKHFAKEDF
ncbi:MAG: hypothetical protein JNK63_11735 [Chthonomonas sp.]|nr:hypothetical protein [Chthonomonas sp.]